MKQMAQKGLKKIEELRGLGKADYHIHTNYSDGRPTVQEVLDHVQEHTDLDVIAIADHDTMKGAFEAQTLMQKGSYRFEFILAEEVTAKEGHILGLFLKEEIPAGLTTQEVIKRIHSQGGLAIAVHPFEQSSWNNAERPVMNGVGFMTLFKIGNQFDGMEIVNATPFLADENLRASLVNKTFIFQAETGGSDAHIVEAIGMGYTLFESASGRKTAKDFRWAIHHHQTRAMYAKWTLLALIKYGFFFFPMGLRMLINTIVHGKKKYPEEI